MPPPSTAIRFLAVVAASAFVEVESVADRGANNVVRDGHDRRDADLVSSIFGLLIEMIAATRQS